MQRAYVLLPTALDHGFDYLVPEGMQVAPGDLVEVTLAGRKMVGVVWHLYLSSPPEGLGARKIGTLGTNFSSPREPASVSAAGSVGGESASPPTASPSALRLPLRGGAKNVPADKLKPIATKLTSMPPFSHTLMRWLEWVASYCLAPMGAVVKMALSTGGALTHPPRHPYQSPVVAMALPPLTAVQKRVVDEIVSIPERVHKTLVIDGVTGSGKTELYYGVIAEHLARRDSAQILVMLPEIALTHQWLLRFRKIFGFDPVVWHSQVSPAARKRAYLAVANGAARVVVGARSALFLPYADLSLIVVDEEHEPSYKQEDGVLYHARDMAVARGAAEKIPVLLVSATPSLETLANVASGKYLSFHLPERHGGVEMPEVSLIDMRGEALDRGNFLSPTLRGAMLGALGRGEQVLLFLNRRGYAPLLLCRHCGHRFQCSDCSAWLVLHKKGSGVQVSGSGADTRNPKPGTLHCHHCGHREPEPKACPACKAEGALVACGPGVERVAEEVREMFGIPASPSPVIPAEAPGSREASPVHGDPGVAAQTGMTGEGGAGMTAPGREKRLPRLSVLSTDNGVTPEEIEAIIAGERDIIIGTQMVAKGHHFPKLSTVGVVDADMGLQGGDLRASERAFQLLHQLSGRAGREAIRGHVYLQTYAPEHPVMQALAAGDAKRFLALEREGRQHAGWPPYGQLASLLFDGASEAEVRRVAEAVVRSAPADTRVRVLGPAPAALSRLKGQYRYRVLVKTSREVHLQKLLAGWLSDIPLPRSVRLKVDVNPYSFV